MLTTLIVALVLVAGLCLVALWVARVISVGEWPPRRPYPTGEVFVEHLQTPSDDGPKRTA